MTAAIIPVLFFSSSLHCFISFFRFFNSQEHRSVDTSLTGSSSGATFHAAVVLSMVIDLGFVFGYRKTKRISLLDDSFGVTD